MLRNYLATALRNMVRNRLYAAINVIGLAVGFAAALLIGLYVRDELTYDRFLPGYQDIYLVGSQISLPGRPREDSDFMAAEMAPFLKAEFPMIAAMARLVPDNLSVAHGAVENTERVHWADSSIFDIFGFEGVSGSLANALKEPNGVVITRKMARKYFGRDDPVGESLELGMGILEDLGDTTRATFKRDVFKVTAVIADLPSNTHLNFNILAAANNATSLTTRLAINPPRNYVPSAETYIKLPGAAAAERVQSGLAAFMKRRTSSLVASESTAGVSLTLHPIASLHLTPSSGRIEKPRGNLDMIYGMAGLGLLVMLAAVINFVNLMTARSIRRATEVGVRKTAGAGRRDLILQFIGEAIIYVTIGMGGGLALAAVLLPDLNAFLDRTIGIALLSDAGSLGFAAALVVVVGVLAGLYPAFILASLAPAAMLGGAGRPASSFIRQALVALQFALLIGLLIATGVVSGQAQYALTEAQRLDTDQVVLVMGGAPCAAAFKDGLRAIPGVRDAACSSSAGLALGGGSSGPAKGVNGTYVTVARASVGYDFFELYGLKPVAGRFFSEAHPADTMPGDRDAPAQGTVVLNEAAARRLGFASPQAAVGKTTSLNEKSGAPSKIIGVVPDFAGDAVHSAVPATVYFINHDYQGVLSVRIDGARAPETLAAIDRLWKEVGPPYPIIRQFLNDVIANRYQDIVRLKGLFFAFAAVVISIAVLGLFGMSAAFSEQRTKEVGIRKAMGAGKAEIMRLVLRQFARPVTWANAIAWPVTYFIMRRWLEGFAYHVDLSPWTFLAASAVALVIAIATVLGHAVLVARAEPVSALRYE